jgi:hypothetical protein
MRIEAATKVMWGAIVPTLGLFMVVTFFLFATPHVCSGKVDCTHVTYGNGSVRAVPEGEYADAAPSLGTALFFALMVGFSGFGILAWNVAKQIRNNPEDDPTAREEETESSCGRAPKGNTGAGSAGTSSTVPLGLPEDAPTAAPTG